MYQTSLGVRFWKILLNAQAAVFELNRERVVAMEMNVLRRAAVRCQQPWHGCARRLGLAHKSNFLAGIDIAVREIDLARLIRRQIRKRRTGDGSLLGDEADH